MDSFCKLLKEKADELGIHYSVLLQLVFDKKFLILNFAPRINKIDREIDNLQKQIHDLEHQKAILSSMVCEMHGHTIGDYDAFSNTQYCKICGKELTLKNTNAFLDERNQLDKGFYPKK